MINCRQTLFVYFIYYLLFIIYYLLFLFIILFPLPFFYLPGSCPAWPGNLLLAFRVSCRFAKNSQESSLAWPWQSTSRNFPHPPSLTLALFVLELIIFDFHPSLGAYWCKSHQPLQIIWLNSKFIRIHESKIFYIN